MATTETSADTRARILEVAWQLAREHGLNAVSVKEIAAAAGVSRQLIYFHYENRAGLLTAMARHQDVTSGMPEAIAAARELPPTPAFEALVRAWCEYVPEIRPVARALEAALITGDEGAAAWENRFAELRAIVRHALRRLAEAGELSSDWDVESASDWAWALLQIGNWDYLVEMRGWEPAVYAERITRTLVDELTQDASKA